MSAMKLLPMEVDGCTVYRCDDSTWAKDVDLAEWAELAKARNVKSVIRGLIADEIAQVIGDGAERVLKEISGARTEGATKSSANGRASGGDAAKRREFHSVHTEGAVIRAEKALVPNGNRGGTQEVIEFYLNREAALHLINRLRTPRAIQAQVRIIRTFMLVEDGQLGGAQLKEALARIVALEARCLDAERRLGDAQSSTILEPEQKEITALRDDAATFMVENKLARTIASARRTITNVAIEPTWDGPISTIPRGEKAAAIKRDLGRAKRRAVKEARRLRRAAQVTAATRHAIARAGEPQKREAKKAERRRIDNPAQQSLFH